MSEAPGVVYESTAIEVVRKEGSTLSAKYIGPNILAGNILAAGGSAANASGLSCAFVGSGQLATVAGVALMPATSGQRVTVIKGKVRAFFDGSATASFGQAIDLSTAQSGWFEPAGTSGVVTQLGFFFGTGAGSSAGATASGTLQVVVLQ